MEFALMTLRSRQRGGIASDVQTIQQRTFEQGSVVGVGVGLGIEVEWHEWPAKQSRREVEGVVVDGDG